MSARLSSFLVQSPAARPTVRHLRVRSVVVLEGLRADASLSDVSTLAPVAVDHRTARFFCVARDPAPW